MQPQFWKDRWAEGKIGFHEGKPNHFLAQFRAHLAGTRVLVPLCGKTEDLAFLAAQGHQVVGIELVEDAVAAFFAEHDVTPAIERRGDLAIYMAGDIRILAGDLFSVQPADVGTIDSIYDRAALIALPSDLRPRYVAHLRSLVAPATPALLVTLEYPQDLMPGPPFSVPEAEVRALYGQVAYLAEGDVRSGRAGELGVARERCYLVQLCPAMGTLSTYATCDR